MLRVVDEWCAESEYEGARCMLLEDRGKDGGSELRPLAMRESRRTLVGAGGVGWPRPFWGEGD